MGLSVTVMHSAHCCNIHSLSSYTSCWKTTSAFLHLLRGITGWIPPGSYSSHYVMWKRCYSNTAGYLHTQHEVIFDSVKVRKQIEVSHVLISTVKHQTQNCFKGLRTQKTGSWNWVTHIVICAVCACRDEERVRIKQLLRLRVILQFEKTLESVVEWARGWWLTSAVMW